MTALSKEAILDKLRQILADNFQLNPEAIQPNSHLFQDLDLDSIDAVELVIQMQSLTGKRVKAEAFKEVRTVQDVVDVVHRMLQES